MRDANKRMLAYDQYYRTAIINLREYHGYLNEERARLKMEPFMELNDPSADLFLIPR